MIPSRRTLSGLVIMLVFLVLVFRSVELADVWAAFQGVNYLLLAPAVLVYFASFWLRAWRWRLLLAHLGVVTVRRSYWVTTIGYAANNVLPLRLGELLRAYLLRRKPGVNAASALGTIAVERVLDGLTLLAWLGVILFVGASDWELSPTLRVSFQSAAVLFGSAALAFFLVLLLPGLALRFLEALLRPLPDAWSVRILDLARTFLTGLETLRRGRMFPAYILLSNGIWAGEAVLYLLVARALGMDASLVTILAAVAASNLATSIPSSSGAIGPFELLAKETVILSGVTASLATAYAILVHATLLIPVTVVGGVFLLMEGVSLKEAVRLPQLETTAPPDSPSTEVR